MKPLSPSPSENVPESVGRIPTVAPLAGDKDPSVGYRLKEKSRYGSEPPISGDSSDCGMCHALPDSGLRISTPLLTPPFTHCWT